MRVKSAILQVNELTAATQSAMLCLMQEHYQNIEPLQFEKDLKKKDQVILLTAGGKLCGFSTQVLHEHIFRGTMYQILFSGDTIVHSQHRNSLSLPIAGGKMMLEILNKGKGKPLYWLLTSKGYRTYKFLPLFFKEYYPGHHNMHNEFEKLLIEDFCIKYFREKFDRKNWLIKANKNSQHLNYRDGKITEAQRKNPDIAFFEKRNPGYLRGDELVCFAAFNQDNIKPSLWKHLVKK